MTTKTKALAADISSTAKGFTAIITAETIDRDGEVLIPGGMNSATFETNPVLFWNHDYEKPVGRATSIKRREKDIVADFIFAKRPDGYSGEFFPEVAAALVGQGIVKGVSVGYTSETGGTRRASEVDRKKYGDGVHTVYSRWKLLEISLAPLQANPEALITAVKKGIVSPVAAKRLFGIEPPRRVSIVVPIAVKRADSSAAAAKPIDADAIIAREIARARGRLWS